MARRDSEPAPSPGSGPWTPETGGWTQDDAGVWVKREPDKRHRSASGSKGRDEAAGGAAGRDGSAPRSGGRPGSRAGGARDEDSANIRWMLVGLLVVVVAVLLLVWRSGGLDGLKGLKLPGQGAIALNRPATVDSHLDVHGKSVPLKVRITVTGVTRHPIVKNAASAGKAAKAGPVRPVDVSMQVANSSSVPLTLLGADQQVHVHDGATWPGQPKKIVVPPAKTRKITFTFLIPAAASPDRATLAIAGKSKDFKLLPS